MLTIENKNAFKIHKTLIDSANKVIQLAIEHKIQNQQRQRVSISEFLRRSHQRLNHRIQTNNTVPFYVKELEEKIRESCSSNNQNQYPTSLENFDITIKISIARNLLLNRATWRDTIDMNNLDFNKCLNNIRIIRNNFYGHLKKYEISEADYNLTLDNLKKIIEKLVESFDQSRITFFLQEIENIQKIVTISVEEFEQFKTHIEIIQEQIQFLIKNFETLRNQTNENELKTKRIEEEINENKISNQNLSLDIEQVQNQLIELEGTINKFKRKEISRDLICDVIVIDARHFIELDQHKTILEELINSNQTDLIILQGIGGIGKTTLAIYLANKLYNEYDFKYKWFNNFDDLNEKYREILEKEFDHLVADKKYTINSLSEKLKEEQSKTLFVFDNFENLDNKKNYILGLPSKIKIIVTTRNQELTIGNASRKSKKFSLQTLNREQARQFLVETEEIKNLKLSEKKLNKILIDLMPNGSITPFKLNISVNLIAENKTEKLVNIMEKLKSNPNETVYIELLITSFNNKSPEKFLMYLSLLNTSFVEKDFFEKLLDEFDTNQIKETLELLSKQSLIRPIRKNDDYGYEVHDFIVQTVHERKNEDIVKIFFELVKKIEDICEEKIYKNILIENNILTHFNQILKYYLLNKQTNKALERASDQQELARTLNTASVANAKNLDYEKYLEYSLESLTIYEIIYKEEPYHPDLAAVLQNVGSAYCSNGKYQNYLEYSLKSFEKYKTIYKNEPFHPALAKSFKNVGAAYGRCNDYEKDLEYSLKSFEKYETIYKNEPYNIEMASILSNVGTSYAKIGDHKNGLEYSLKSLEINKIIHKDKPYHPDLISIFKNVSAAYRSNGESEKCLEYSLKSLEICENLIKEKPYHPDLASCYLYVSDAHGYNENYKMQLEYSLKALNIYETIYKGLPDQPELAKAFNSVAMAYCRNKKYEEQLEYSLKSLKIYEIIFQEKPTHPDLAAILNNVASAYGGNKKYEKQLEYSLKSFIECQIIFQDRPHNYMMELYMMEASYNILSSIFHICMLDKNKLIILRYFK